MSNVAFLLVLLDVSVYLCAPEKENFELCVRKEEKGKGENEHNAQKGAELKNCPHQYLYISEQLRLGLGRKLYSPPLE